MQPSDAPLVITLALDPDSQTHFDELRRRWFPPERLQVGAHLTLFHKISAEHMPAVLRDCADAARRPVFAVHSVAVRSLGRGVAIDLDARELLEVRARLRASWEPWLSAQDRSGFRPHVTIQNKVDADTARETTRIVADSFAPGRHTARGIDVWRYLGGPWEHAHHVPFRAD